MKTKHLVSPVLAALVASLGLFTPASASTITIGVDAGTNLYPWGSTYAGEYQQVYNGSAFGGTVLITGISFFPFSVTNAISGSYVIDLSTTAASTLVGPAGLSTSYASNLGPNTAQFFAGAVSNVSTFTGTPFLYDPSKGNLLMDVDTLRGGSIQGAAAGCSNDTNRVYNAGGTGTPTIGLATCTGNSGFGLETQFTFTPVGGNAVTPEPSSIVLLGTGLLTLAAAARRRLLRRA